MGINNTYKISTENDLVAKSTKSLISARKWVWSPYMTTQHLVTEKGSVAAIRKNNIATKMSLFVRGLTFSHQNLFYFN